MFVYREHRSFLPPLELCSWIASKVVGLLFAFWQRCFIGYCTLNRQVRECWIIFGELQEPWVPKHDLNLDISSLWSTCLGRWISRVTPRLCNNLKPEGVQAVLLKDSEAPKETIFLYSSHTRVLPFITHTHISKVRRHFPRPTHSVRHRENPGSQCFHPHPCHVSDADHKKLVDTWPPVTS